MHSQYTPLPEYFNGKCGVCALELGGRKFVVRHEVDVRFAGEALRPLLLRERPDVVVFRYTHRPCIERWGEVLLFNPGYVGNQPAWAPSVKFLMSWAIWTPR